MVVIKKALGVVKNNINSLPQRYKIMILVLLISFGVFSYVLNNTSPFVSDCVSYGFLIYLIICDVLFLLRKHWFLAGLTIFTTFTVLYSVFWFLL